MRLDSDGGEVSYNDAGLWAFRLSNTTRITGMPGYASSTSQRIWRAKSCMVRCRVMATWGQPRRGSQVRNRLRVPALGYS